MGNDDGSLRGPGVIVRGFGAPPAILISGADMLQISEDDLHGSQPPGCLINAASRASAHVLKEDLCEWGSAGWEVQPRETIDIFPFKSTEISISTPRVILRHKFGPRCLGSSQLLLEVWKGKGEERRQGPPFQ